MCIDDKIEMNLALLLIAMRTGDKRWIEEIKADISNLLEIKECINYHKPRLKKIKEEFD